MLCFEFSVSQKHAIVTYHSKSNKTHHRYCPEERGHIRWKFTFFIPPSRYLHTYNKSFLLPLGIVTKKHFSLPPSHDVTKFIWNVFYKLQQAVVSKTLLSDYSSIITIKQNALTKFWRKFSSNDSNFRKP